MQKSTITPAVFTCSSGHVSEGIRKRIFIFFTKQINLRLHGSLPRVDSSVPLMHHDLRDLRLICMVKKCKNRFWILLDFLTETHSQ